MGAALVPGEVAHDLGQPHPMRRLLQGDVGSGKTVVAEYSMLLAVAHGFQAALMAPTEILARQHAATLQRDLHESRVRIQLLTGSLSAAQRRPQTSAMLNSRGTCQRKSSYSARYWSRIVPSRVAGMASYNRRTDFPTQT